MIEEPCCPTCHKPLDGHEARPCINGWAAELFGWPGHDWNGIICRRCHADRNLVKTRPDEYSIFCHRWKPSQRIEDAWWLVQLKGDEAWVWEVLVGPSGAMAAVGGEPDPPKTHASSAALAITKAAIRARLEQRERDG